MVRMPGVRRARFTDSAGGLDAVVVLGVCTVLLAAAWDARTVARAGSSRLACPACNVHRRRGRVCCD